MSFDKELLFSMFQPKVVPVTVEHDGKKQELFVRELSADQVFRLQEQQKRNGQDNEAFTINLLSQAICDENGKRVLDDKSAKQLAGMQIKAFNALTRAVSAAVGLTVEDKKVSGNSDLETAQVQGNA